MKTVTLLIGGREVLVDDDKENIAFLAQFAWNISSGGYAIATVRKAKGVKKTYGMHRLVMRDEDNPLHVDHITRNPLDNRRENLRFVTHSANCLNSRKRRGTSSAHKGVSRSGDKWQVVVRVDGKLKWIGKYATEAEAAAVAAPFFSDVAHNPTSRAA